MKKIIFYYSSLEGGGGGLTNVKNSIIGTSVMSNSIIEKYSLRDNKESFEESFKES